VTLLVLYGPPAVGKLTVANHLAKTTGFKVFHNHVSIDVATNFFERGTPEFSNIIYGMRRLFFEELTKANISFIFTIVYAHPQDIPDMRWMIEAVENQGGKVKFVQLVSSKETLLERVHAPSRQAFGKIIDPELLRTILNQYDLFTPYPEREHPSFDTSKQGAEAVAEQIIKHFELTTLGPKSS
jgi:tRNA uridine 5-carbamoylmethylation protein Kti12